MKEFDEIYKEIITYRDEEFNASFENAKRLKKNVFIGSFVALIILGLFFKKLGFIIGMAMTVGILVIAKLILSHSSKTKEYIRQYKEKVIKKFLTNAFGDVRYMPDQGMPTSIYRQGKYESYDRYYSDDYFEGKIDGKELVRMAEVTTEREETKEDSEGNTTTTYVTIFSGLFAKIDLQKSIKCELDIHPNRIDFFKRDKVEMDSSEFEKYFDVNSTDKIVTMQLLTSDVMEILIDFTEKNDMKYDVYINNNEMYLRFYCGSVFEIGNLRKGIVDEKLIEKYYNIIKFSYELPKSIITTINNTEL